MWGTWISPPASIEPMTLTWDLGMANRSAVWTTLLLLKFFAGRGSSIGRASAWYGSVADSIITSGKHSLEEIGHEKVSTTILSLSLIQERQLSVTGERMCTNGTGKLPRRLPGNSVDRLTDRARNDLKTVKILLNLSGHSFVARSSITNYVYIQDIFDTCMYLWLMGRPQIQNILLLLGNLATLSPQAENIDVCINMAPSIFTIQFDCNLANW